MLIKRKSVSLSRKIFSLSFLLSIGLAIILTTSFALVFYPRQLESARSFLKEKNSSLNIYVEAYFKEIINSIRILSANLDVIDGSLADSAGRERMLELFRTFQSVNPNIYFIYAAYTDGQLLINNYEPPEGYDPRVRPWYRAVMDSPQSGAMVVGLLYSEAISNELLLSTIHILESDTQGFSGVVAIDSYTVAIADQIAARSGFFPSAYSFITDSTLDILVHPDQTLVGSNIAALTQDYQAPDTDGYFKYMYEGAQKLAYSSYMPLTGWHIVTAVNESELLWPILQTLAVYALLVLLLVTLIGVLNVRIWSRMFLEPLLGLHDRVSALFDSCAECAPYQFPDNELGEIAANIEKLTSSALFNKSRELEAANARILEINSELQNKNDLLGRLAVHDYLTNIYNRRKLEEILAEEYEKYLRYAIPCVVIMFDIDLFKEVNDNFGHKEGDNVLQEISEIARQHLRKSDVFGRWGGEEFLIILFNTTMNTALEVAEKLRLMVASHQFSILRQLTISLGVAESQKNEHLDDFMRRVDTCLYKAKETGRNRTVW